MKRMLAEATFQIALFTVVILIGGLMDHAIGWGVGLSVGFGLILLLNWSKLFDRLWPKHESAADK